MATGEPTTAEMLAFIARLRDQANFLQDPALTDAAAFLQRIYDSRQMRETEAPGSSGEQPSVAASKQSDTRAA